MSAVPLHLLIGASGRVGRMVCHHWPDVSAGAGLSWSCRGSAPPASGGFRWDPITGPRALVAQLCKTGVVPECLIMLAGVTPGPGVDEDALAGNARLAEACLAAARATGIGRVLLASSSAIYGVDPQGLAFEESARPRPTSAYGRAKQDMEAVGQRAREAGLEVCALRIGNVAGADALLAPLTGRRPDAAQPLRIDGFADGAGPLRSYIGAASLTRVLLTLGAQVDPLPQALNVAAPCPVRMEALAVAAGWPHVMVPAPETAHQCITLDCGRLNRLCPMFMDDSDPAVMVQQWKATFS